MLLNRCLVVGRIYLYRTRIDHHLSNLQIEAAAEEKSRNERLGADVGVLPDSDLFFIDKVLSVSINDERFSSCYW